MGCWGNRIRGGVKNVGNSKEWQAGMNRQAYIPLDVAGV